MLSTETEAERQVRRRRAAAIFEPTGEPMGETEWRRWRTESGWHPNTPKAILDEYGWLFEFSEHGGRRDA